MPSDRLPRDRPLLTTERLELWLPQAGDARMLYDLLQDPDTHRFLGPPDTFAGHFGRFQRAAGSWLLHGYGALMLRERGTEAVIGNCGVFHSWRGIGDDMDDTPEGAWVIGADHTGQGYAREAMEAVLAWFDETHGPKRITAMIEPGNDASFALAARLGFEEFRRTEQDGCEVVLLERTEQQSDLIKAR